MKFAVRLTTVRPRTYYNFYNRQIPLAENKEIT